MTKPKGFAVLGSEAARKAGSKGGKAAHRLPRKQGPHKFTRAEAQEASRKGVLARQRKALERAKAAEGAPTDE